MNMMMTKRVNKKDKQMKRVIIKIGLFAAAMGMVFSCAKGDKNEPEPKTFERTVQVTFTKDLDTKTALVEGEDKASYIWSDGDEQYFKVWENSTLGTVNGIVLSSDKKIATLSVTFNTSNNSTEYVYKALFAKGFSNSDNLQIQSTQSPTATSYDPSADVMYAEELTSSTAVTSLKFVLRRAITVNKITLKGMTAGEKVSNVEITFNKNVAGYFNPSNGNYSLDGKKLTLTYSDLAVGQDGTFPVYFISAPAEGISLQNVVVYTDLNTYTRTEFSKTYNFQIGKMVRFGLNMEGTATPVISSDLFTLVDSEADLTPGTYIIAASDYNYAMGSLADASTKYHYSEGAAKDGNTITLPNTSPVLIWEVAQNGSSWTFKNIKEDDPNKGKYLAWTSGNSSTELSSSFLWDISIAEGVATITCPSPYDSYTLQYNSSSPRFACYTSNQTPIALYKRTGGGLPLGISFATGSYALKIGTSDYTSFTGQTVTKNPSDTRTVTYSMSGTSIGTIDSSTGVINLDGATTGTATITATVQADESHSSGSVSYSITVTSNSSDYDYDYLDNLFIGVSGNNYADKSGLVGSSGRGSLYSTNSAGSYGSIQLRSNYSNSGIVTTASGGKVVKVEITWNSNTASGRKLNIYGKNSAYSSPSDLYDSNKQGTLLGTLTCGTSTVLTITGDYAYLGIRSSKDAMYLDNIKVYWTDGTPSTAPVINVTSDNPVTVAKEGGTEIIEYNITNPVAGVSLTASANVTWISNISVNSSASTVSFTVSPQAAGASSRTGTITLSYSGATSVNVTVGQERGEGGSTAANGWLELPAMQEGEDFINGVMDTLGKRNYSYMYQYSTYTCLWVAYPLYPEAISSNEMSKSKALGPYQYTPDNYSEELRATWYFNYKIPNPKVTQVNICSSSYGVDYGSTTYARGHQIANADRSGSAEMNKQTYYVTNSTPQIQNGFNGGIWSSLEGAVRATASSDTVYVVTGATFRTVGGNENITYINPKPDPYKSVPVPNYYWKVLLKVKRSGSTITDAKAIGFWLEHKQYSGSSYASYTKSVSQIETLTGFDFFVNLPSNLEATAKANTSWENFQSF